ncbi:putative serine carboxypeptidase 24-like [Capsicum annuum]|nr:putative serine carboxypeptidase 24-like [Capsicum annuum]
MKRGALESSSYGVFEEPKVRLKHQRLLQDYKGLQKETDGIMHKLEDSKLRKLRLLAEVRFLRQRHSYLLQLKSLSPPKGKELVSLPQVTSKNKLPPLPGPKQNGRIQIAKVAASKKTPDVHVKRNLVDGKHAVFHNADFELNRKSIVYSGKEVLSSLKGSPADDLKQNERLYIANNAILQSTSATSDLNQDTGHSGKAAALPTRAPVFDLNEISTGEEETEVNFEQVQLEEPNRSLIRNLNDDVKLLNVCRDVGEGTSRVGERKLSWQDPVAVRV